MFYNHFCVLWANIACRFYCVHFFLFNFARFYRKKKFLRQSYIYGRIFFLPLRDTTLKRINLQIDSVFRYIICCKREWNESTFTHTKQSQMNFVVVVISFVRYRSYCARFGLYCAYAASYVNCMWRYGLMIEFDVYMDMVDLVRRWLRNATHCGATLFTWSPHGFQ